MTRITNQKSYKPTCPNHGCALAGIGFPMPKKGTGICPVSMCPFDFEVDVDDMTMTQDKFGNAVKQKNFNVTGDDA